jgi:hypothetical protein
MVYRATSTFFARTASAGDSVNTTHTLSAESFSRMVSILGRAKEAAEKEGRKDFQ